MRKIVFISICCALLFATKAHAQTTYLSLQYEAGFGTGDLGEFISKASWRGALIEYRAGLSDKLLVGADVGWNVFYEKKDYDTYTQGTVALSGKQYRYDNKVPLLAAVDYIVSPDNSLKPYVGLGIGTMYSERATDMNLYRLSETTWHFALKGELGVMYEVGYTSSVKLSAKYYNGFKTATLENQGYFSIGLGMIWEL